ncbi:hypothetical protein [Halorubrum sp. Boch-26]|nr:hypothetical protein [Halorubrum sp. Boch-26]
MTRRSSSSGSPATSWPTLDAYTRVADLFAKYLREFPDDGSSRPYEPPE